MKRARKVLKKYFIPHEENDHKPHILRAKSVIFVLVVAFVVESIFWVSSSIVAPRSRLFGIILTNALVSQANTSRTSDNLPTLHESPLLDVAAEQKANDMVANNYFAHTSPAGISPWHWFEKVGYSFTYAGENLAVNFSDSQDVTNAWMNSPEHRANILNTNFTEIGMATAQGTYQGHPAVYVVELFGTPAPAMPPAEAPVGFVNTAAAATLPAPHANSTSSSASKPIVKSVSAPVSAIPSPATNPNQTFVAVKGAETQAAASPVVVTATPQAAPVAVASAAPRMNPIQSIIANSRQIVDYLYLAIILLFALALGINIFVKIKIQHPQIIFGGMLIILVAGLFIVLNQHALVSAAIL